MRCKVKPIESECYPIEYLLNTDCQYHGEQPDWLKKCFENKEFTILTPEGGGGPILHTPYAIGVIGDMLVCAPNGDIDLFTKEEFEIAFEIIKE